MLNFPVVPGMRTEPRTSGDLACGIRHFLEERRRDRL